MRRRLAHQVSAAVLLAVGCAAQPPANPSSAREQTLDRAFAVAETDPAGAAILFAEAGPSAALERARMAVWGGLPRTFQRDAGGMAPISGRRPSR